MVSFIATAAAGRRGNGSLRRQSVSSCKSLGSNRDPPPLERQPLLPASPRRAAALAAAASISAAILLAGNDANAYGLVKGRLAKCTGDIPCISTTSVGNPSKFGPPWSYQPQTDDPDAAWSALKQAVSENRDNGKIVESLDGPKEYYLRAEFPSSIRGTDDVEFRLVKDDSLVTYRSASREAIFLYPLQTPINFDKNRTRLSDIRNSLGWEEFAGFNLFGTPKE